MWPEKKNIGDYFITVTSKTEEGYNIGFNDAISSMTKELLARTEKMNLYNIILDVQTQIEKEHNAPILGLLQSDRMRIVTAIQSHIRLGLEP